MIDKLKKNFGLQKFIVVVTFFISIGLFYSNPDQFISDNSLFYPVVAQNIVNMGMSSFNGYIETYGYQPLWMLVSVLSVLISKVFSFDLLIVIGFFYHFFLAGAIVTVFKMEKRWPFFSAPIVSLVLIFMFVSNGVLHNMESALALFFVLISIYYALKIEQLNHKNLFIFALLLGLTFLSRLDLFFFTMVLSSYLFFVFRKELYKEPVNLLFYLLGIVLVVSPYLVHNLLSFGALLPLSDRFSHGFPTLAYAWENIYPYGAVSFIIALIEWGIAWMATSRQARVIILIMSVSTILQVVYVAFFMHPQSWYFITGFVNFALIIGYLLMKIDRVWLINMTIGALVIVTIASSYLKTVSNYALSAHVLKLYQEKVGKASLKASDKSDKLEYANDIKKVLRPGTTAYVGFFPGALAYYAHLRVFAANGLSDGLMANTVFEDALREKGLDAIMKQYHIAYQVVPLSRGAVLWYGNMGFNVANDNEYSVMLYAKTSPEICGKMDYSHEGNLTKVRLGYASTGYAGIFPTKEVGECTEEMKAYKKSGFYSTLIGK